MGDAARQAHVVIVIVSDNEASKAVWLDDDTGVVHGLSPEKIAVTSSTLTPAWSRELAAHLESLQVPFLEAPVVGTRPQAEQGELVYLVGGQKEVLESVRDVFDVLGGKVLHLGGVGAAMNMKLAINAMLGIQAAALAETMQMIRETMEAPEEVLELFKGLPVMSPLMNRLVGKMQPGNYAPNFPIELVEKDLRYFVEARGAEKAAHSFVEATRRVYRSAMASGYGQDDITGIIQLFER